MSPDDLHNFLAQTAAFRFEPDWESVRTLLVGHGMNAQEMLLFGCDHAGGDDMALWLALPDGSIVNCRMRQDQLTQRYSSVIEWRTVEPDSDFELLSARHIASDARIAHAFSIAVEAYHVVCKSLASIQPDA